MSPPSSHAAESFCCQASAALPLTVPAKRSAEPAAMPNAGRSITWDKGASGLRAGELNASSAEPLADVRECLSARLISASSRSAKARASFSSACNPCRENSPAITVAGVCMFNRARSSAWSVKLASTPQVPSSSAFKSGISRRSLTCACSLLNEARVARSCVACSAKRSADSLSCAKKSMPSSLASIPLKLTAGDSVLLPLSSAETCACAWH